MATKSILLNFVNIRTYIEHTIGDQKKTGKAVIARNFDFTF